MILLRAHEVEKAWGAEQWLNSTRPEGRATLAEAPGGTLAELLAAEPALLGEWSRRLYGDELPIFTKLIRTDFPPLVHVGFRRAMDRTTLVGWLAREQALLRQIFAALDFGSRDTFERFASIYSTWATLQAGARWLHDDDAAIAEQLSAFARACGGRRLGEWIGQLRRNRAQLVDALNEVDLRREEGNLLLTSAGIVHAIFGLSHQTHPLDGTRAALESLLARLKRLARAGGSDDELRALADAERLPELRARNRGAPKNEAWLPATVDGKLVLVEPQQTSDTTYSLADFYTPFVWSAADGRARFRKGHAAHGLGSDELMAYLDAVDFSATSIDRIRRAPVNVGCSHRDAAVYRLVDEPADWPFFTAYRIDLDGKAAAPSTLGGDHAPGVFQQLVVLRGTVEIADAHGRRATLDSRAPAFIPATLEGGYQLSSEGAASVLVFSVPSPRAGCPHDV
ncbi:MAG TPA: hypothetical protein VFF06_00350 [Polyangia bacterium]|nr:hypothetical protein [Polyangia bacterium]